MANLFDKVIFDVFVPEVGRWIPRKFKAKIFDHEGRRFKLFTISTLAKVLCRNHVAIRNWQKDGKFPQAIFEVESESGRVYRYYSETQIRMASAHQREILGDNPRSSVNGFSDHDAFFEAVRNDWYQELDEDE